MLGFGSNGIQDYTMRAPGMIMAGGKGERLFPLTKERSKPAVPFGGKYRIIDFVCPILLIPIFFLLIFWCSIFPNHHRISACKLAYKRYQQGPFFNSGSTANAPWRNLVPRHGRRYPPEHKLN